MDVLITGADGYLGVPLADRLIALGHRVVGIDAGFHRSGWLFDSGARRPTMLTRDTRDLMIEDLVGFDALVHLAELSNDPVGELHQDVTYDINHRATVRLAKLAKRAGIARFVHMSSCSVYGASGRGTSTEDDATDPLTAYARCKVMVEHDVGQLADSTFAPTFLRNATAFGASPRQRFDLVINELAATAFVAREIRMASDGSPWRPFVHVKDIARAVACALDAPTEIVCGTIFNVGSAAGNHQVRDIAEMIATLVPGCELSFGEPGTDRRTYRADFSKIHDVLPGFECMWSVEDGLVELLDIFARIGLTRRAVESRGHSRIKQIKYLLATGQIDSQFRWTDPERQVDHGEDTLARC